MVLYPSLKSEPARHCFLVTILHIFKRYSTEARAFWSHERSTPPHGPGDCDDCSSVISLLVIASSVLSLTWDALNLHGLSSK